MAIGPRKGVLLRANLGRAIVSNGDFTASVCHSASTVEAAVWGGACGGPKHCCLDGSARPTCKGKGGLWEFLFSIFTMRNAIGSLTVKCLVNKDFQIGGPKTTFFRRLRNLTAYLTAYVFGMKYNRTRALATRRGLLDRLKMI